jgi:hypothetical protein
MVRAASKASPELPTIAESADQYVKLVVPENGTDGQRAHVRATFIVGSWTLLQMLGALSSPRFSETAGTAALAQLHMEANELMAKIRPVRKRGAGT